MKKMVVFIAWFCFIFPSIASAGEFVVYQEGEHLIRGYLSESWSIMPEDEVVSFIGSKLELVSEKIKILAGYQLHDDSGNTAMLFVFYAQPEERISWEQRQNMFNWFKGNTSFTSGIFSDNMQGVTLENIEYLQDKDTLLFEAKVKIDGAEISGVNGIIFLRSGYLDIAGYATEGAKEHLTDFYSFMKTLSVSPGLRYTQTTIWDISSKWFQDNWQQILGGIIFVLVYGITFLNKDRSRLAGSRLTGGRRQ